MQELQEEFLGSDMPGSEASFLNPTDVPPPPQNYGVQGVELLPYDPGYCERCKRMYRNDDAFQKT